MMAELGVFALVLALIVALVQATLPLLGAQWGIAAWVRLARPAATADGFAPAAAAGGELARGALAPAPSHRGIDQPQRAPTPGQAVVLYQGDVVLGGGTITQVAKG